jgi:CRP/FNR family transcriptional regulator, cyclic AMP receptor protein
MSRIDSKMVCLMPSTVSPAPDIRLLEEEPELGETIPGARRAVALERCTASTVRVPRGRWAVPNSMHLYDGIGLLLLEGLLLRRVGVDGRFGAEILGEGDLMRPRFDTPTTTTLSVTAGWRVLAPARLAVLDLEAARRFAEFPELTGAFVDRAINRTRNLQILMAIVHHARVNVRVHMLLWHLADRWGRVRSEGVVLPLSITHSVLADMVAARRPTVTSALSELARMDLVRPVEGGWLLRGDRPGELEELAVPDVAGRDGVAAA